MSDKQEITGKVQQQFGDHAQNYVNSSIHAQGTDLERIVQVAAPQPDDIALDVATGGGHTALKLAPHVKAVTATDITQAMLDAAQAFVTPQASNVTFKLADAEALPFEDESFDIVTCRIAAHHFSDIYRFVLESVRVLRPGGRLVVQDQYAPPDERAADYIDAFERLRDPSHVHKFSAQAWRGAFLDAQLTVVHEEDVSRTADFVPWAKRIGATPEIVEKLEIMMVQAPDAVREWLRPRAIGTPEATIDHRYWLIAGRK